MAARNAGWQNGEHFILPDESPAESGRTPRSGASFKPHCVATGINDFEGFPPFWWQVPPTWEAKRGAAFRPAGTRAPVANSSGTSTTSRNAVGRSEWFLHKARASSRSPHFPVQRRDCCGSTRDLRRWWMGLPEIRQRSSHATSLSDRPTAGASASRSTGACGDRRMTRAGVPGPSRSTIPRRYSAE